MFARIKAVCHDPGMWSAAVAGVLAGAILGVVALIWAVRAVIVSGVSGAIGRAGADLSTGWGWFAGLASIPHWLLILILVCIALLVHTSRRHGATLSRVEEQLLDILYPGPELEPEPEKVVDSFAPTPGQLALLELGYRAGIFQQVPFKYARRALKRIDRSAKWDDAVLALKELKAAGTVTFVNDRFGNGENGTLGYKLTRVGGEYMEKCKKKEGAPKRI